MDDDEQGPFRVGYNTGGNAYPYGNINEDSYYTFNDISCVEPPRIMNAFNISSSGIRSVVIPTKLITDSGTWWEWDGTKYSVSKDNNSYKYRYQWYRGMNLIEGETADSYTTTKDDKDDGVYCEVIAHNPINNLSGYPEKSLYPMRAVINPIS